MLHWCEQAPLKIMWSQLKCSSVQLSSLNDRQFAFLVFQKWKLVTFPKYRGKNFRLHQFPFFFFMVSYFPGWETLSDGFVHVLQCTLSSGKVEHEYCNHPLYSLMLFDCGGTRSERHINHHFIFLVFCFLSIPFFFSSSCALLFQNVLDCIYILGCIKT